MYFIFGGRLVGERHGGLGQEGKERMAILRGDFWWDSVCGVCCVGRYEKTNVELSMGVCECHKVMHYL